MIVADTPDKIKMFQYLTIRSAMYLYLRTGMLANKAYTPKNMRAMVTKVTGHTYQSSRKGTERAFCDLNDWIKEQELKPNEQ
jgi:hypothetical protein